MQRHAALFVVRCVLVISFGQAQPSTGSLAGRVFALAKGGDLRPARLARVFVASGEDQITLQQNLDRALAKHREDIRSNTDVQEACLVASVSVHEAVKSASKIQIADTDEDGNFALSKLHPGTYLVIAIGSAGGKQSIWLLAAEVTSGKRQKVRLAEPVLACR